MYNFAQAVSQLQVSLDTVENNAPIHDREGRHEQAEHGRNAAASYRQAIEVLTNLQLNEISVAKPLTGCGEANSNTDPKYDEIKREMRLVALDYACSGDLSSVEQTVEAAKMFYAFLSGEAP